MSKYGLDYFLTENKTYPYYYNGLNENEKKGYDAIKRGILNFEGKITVTKLDSDSVSKIFEFVLLDNPAIFYLRSMNYQFIKWPKAGVITPVYQYDRQYVDKVLAKLLTIAKLLSIQLEEKSDYEKIIQIHDYLITNNQYDFKLNQTSFEIVGALCNGIAVCEGISKAAKLLFDLLGIKSLVVIGDSLENNDSTIKHGWNMVELGGLYYHLDLTFDLTAMTFKTIRYDYFLLSDIEISKDHVFDGKYLPICNLTFDYYQKQSLYFTSLNDFAQYFKMGLKNKDRDFVFQFREVENLESFRKELVKKVQFIVFFKIIWLHQIQLSINKYQNIYHIHLA